MANAKTETGAVTVKKETAIVAASFLEDDAAKGLEGIQQEDLATPRIKVLMALSPELNEIADAKAGMIYNTVSGELFDGTKGIKVLPCAYVRQYVEWQDRGQGAGAPVNVYGSDSDILTKTTRDNNNKDRLENGNYIETCANHFVLVVGDDGQVSPAVIIMKSTQLKKSRKWNSMMNGLVLQGKNGPYNPPAFSRFYNLKTALEGNDKGKWHGWDITAGEWITDADANLYAQAKKFSESVRSGKETVKHEQDDVKSNNSGDVPF